MNNIRKIVKSLEDSGLLIKGVSEALKNKAIERNGVFLGMLLGTVGATLLGKMLARKGVLRAGEATIRTSQNF